MNLIFRMIYLWLMAGFKPKLPTRSPSNTLTLMVLPNDLDINLHMNNGRYLTICDLSRVDMFIRTGLAKAMIKNSWKPLIAEHTMTYKRSLKPFAKYQVRMDVTGWDEKFFTCEHVFSIGDREVARGVSRSVVYGQGSVIPPEQVIKTVEEQN